MQPCPILFNSMDCSMPGLPVPQHLPEFPSSYSLHRWYCPAISSSDTLFSFCPQSFPAWGTFPMSHLFTSDDQNTRASDSASALPVNIQGWSPSLDWLVQSPCCPRDFQESSLAAQFEGVNSLAFCILYSAVLTKLSHNLLLIKLSSDINMLNFKCFRV